MALISHEVPLDLLDESLKFNDYHYCLPHLLDNDKYFNFFKDASRRREFIIMDNGLFEGVSHTTDDLIERLNEIKPNIFIVPDAWNDPDTTYRNAKAWMTGYTNELHRRTKLMAVVQAENVPDAIEMYSSLSSGLRFDHIALNHSGVFYKELYEHQNPLMSLMMGRVKFIERMKTLSSFAPSIHHHLLGATLPNEFSYYKGKQYEFIKTVDTSNPVIYGLKHGRYPDEVLLDKPKEKLETFFDQRLTQQQISDVLYNVKHFRTLLS